MDWMGGGLRDIRGEGSKRRVGTECGKSMVEGEAEWRWDTVGDEPAESNQEERKDIREWTWLCFWGSRGVCRSHCHLL